MWSSNCSSLQKWNELPSVASLNGSAFLSPARTNYEWCLRFLVPGLGDKSHSIQPHLLPAQNPIIVIGACSIIFNIIFMFLSIFILFWLFWVSVAAHQLSVFEESGDQVLSSCRTLASLGSDFSLCGAWALEQVGLVPAAHGLGSCGRWALGHRLRSCGS